MNYIELANIEINEYCMLNTKTCKKLFYKEKKNKGFTGLYFKDENTFCALYPSKKGPKIFYKGDEYIIKKDLHISLHKRGDNRIFKIYDYNIEIEYKESKYLNWDVWSDEIHIDLFFMIEKSYKIQEFYNKYTISTETG